MKCVVFTGGGTGGHIFPGLAVAEALSSSLDCRIVWIGSAKGVDRKIVESSELHSASPSVLEFLGIPAGKLRRYFSFQNFIDVFKVAAGFIKSFFILLKLKPLFVFSKGGFVSVPPCAAAKFLKIPVITHECDFSPGLATRINSKFANHILVSYQETAELLPASLRSKVICTGNPVRLSFYSGRPENGRSFLNIKSDLPVLFVLGGSLGARQLNDLISDSIEYLVKHFVVVHQIGEANMDQGQKIKESLLNSSPEFAENYKPYPFIKKEMADVLSLSSIVVSRAGANTVWESAAAGKPMILVPLEKGSSRGDQIENAEFFKKKGAAEILLGEDVRPDIFIRLLRELGFEENISGNERLKNMALASAALAGEKPAIVIADFLKSFFTFKNEEL
nr:undecaprenyldiphospho-muramoylpentapeptide beta-N-acetylglucosaminyltransferase [Treponema denticola]